MKAPKSSLRTTHLVFGLFSCLFLVMYSLSGVQMAHLSMTWTLVRDTPLPVRAESTGSPRALALELMREHGLTGDLAAISEQADGFSFQIIKPGTQHGVTYRSGDTTARVTTRTAGLLDMLNPIHHLSGVWHDVGIMNVWGVFVGLVSLALLGLGVTGVWLWFRIHEERVVGGTLLIGSLLVGLSLVILMRIPG